MLKREYAYNPSAINVVEVTEEQAKVLDKMDDFDAYFWSEKVAWLNNGNITEDGQKVVRAEGNHFVIGPENSDLFFRGFGGSKFKFRFHNGEEITSTNVWFQGGIPYELKDILTDNAKTIKDEEF